MKGQHINNILYGIVAAAMMAVWADHGLYAQSYLSPPVEISQEKVKIDGKICYSHIVLEKQTLYSISKAYGVSIEDIYRFNPTLKEIGLKKNSIIIIPSPEAIGSQGAGTATPRQQARPEEKQENTATRVHTAKWYEDLDVIADQYGVSADAIIKANNLKGRKLSKRQKLIIPYPHEKIAEIPENVENQIVSATADTTVTEITVPQEIPSPRNSVNAMLILPLTDAEGEPHRFNMDFYCGVLTAIHDMAENGTDCNLSVCNTMDPKLQLSADSIKDSDFIIGPVSTADLTKFLNIAAEAKAIISPLDPRAEVLATAHNRIIQIPTPHAAQYRDITHWMKEDLREGDKVVMITEKGARMNGVTMAMTASLDSSAVAYSPFSYSILEGRDITEPLTGLMTTEGTNRILIASESEAFVNDVVRNLNLLIHNNLDIVLYSPSKIRSFETIEVENFHNTSMRVSLAYYIDYESQNVKNFLMKYRALYNTEPTQFAFQGYDIMKYFMGLCAKYGDNWKDMIPGSPEDMLQSTFLFKRHPSGGFVNNGVRRIIYGAGYKVNRQK